MVIMTCGVCVARDAVIPVAEQTPIDEEKEEWIALDENRCACGVRGATAMCDQCCAARLLGWFLPGVKRIRRRRKYTQQTRDEFPATGCFKGQTRHPFKTEGLLAGFCPHGVPLGCASHVAFHHRFCI